MLKKVATPNAYGVISIVHIIVRMMAVIHPKDALRYCRTFFFSTSAKTLSVTSATTSATASSNTACSA